MDAEVYVYPSLLNGLVSVSGSFYFIRKFISKNFQKLPNLVTLAAS